MAAELVDPFVPNVEAYLQRIGYGGSSAVGEDVLHAITSHHAASIPFENLDVLSGRGIDLAGKAIERKLVFEKRGGYCFEQNRYLRWILLALGFEVSTLSARVRWLLPREVTPPCTHLFLKVTLPNGALVTDVGIGGCSLTKALKWEDGLIQETPQDQRRLVYESGRWFHQIRFDTKWLDVCEFCDEPMPMIDVEVANWWTSTNPDSKFIRNLIISRTSMDGSRQSLMNREYTIRKYGCAAVKQWVNSPQALEELLWKEFDLKWKGGVNFSVLGFK
jgi:N-hydroxyarylamine O-acetyltransferase